MLQLMGLGFALAASPGPDFFLILRNTLSSGRFIGFMTLLGNRFSLCIHISLAIAGLSIVLHNSATLFLAVRLLGAGYLIYLGGQKLFARLGRNRTRPDPPRVAAVDAMTAARQGFLNNLLNPKVSLFFLSFFPQFTTREALADAPWTVAAVFFVGNSLWWIPLILLVGVSSFRASLYRFQSALDLLFGFVFVGYGLRILVTEVFG
jgi:threonine/homoserine/homoserine lactone efflux protein